VPRDRLAHTIAATRIVAHNHTRLHDRSRGCHPEKIASSAPDALGFQSNAHRNWRNRLTDPHSTTLGSRGSGPLDSQLSGVGDLSGVGVWAGGFSCSALGLAGELPRIISGLRFLIGPTSGSGGERQPDRDGQMATLQKRRSRQGVPTSFRAGSVPAEAGGAEPVASCGGCRCRFV
jgi:hypothetical protein